MVLVDGDPSTDLGALRRVVTVVSDGYVMDADELRTGRGVWRAAEVASTLYRYPKGSGDLLDAVGARVGVVLRRSPPFQGGARGGCER